MKLLLLLIVTQLLGCSIYDPGLPATPNGVSTQDAVLLAKQKIASLAIRLPTGYTIAVSKDVIFAELRPDVPIYVVSFSDPKRRLSIPLYRVEIDRKTGRVLGVIDTHVIIPAGPSE